MLCLRFSQTVRVATIQTNGAELYYERKGQGEPLLLVHGLLFSAESWRDQLDSLSELYDVIAVDLRGQHRSQTTGDLADYDLWNQVEDIHGLISELGIAPVHYAGLSMGGMIGMRLAIRHPEDLRELILLDTSARGEDPEKIERYEAMRQVIHGREDVPIPLAEAELIAARIRGARLEVVEGAGHQSNMDHPDEVTRLIRDFLGAQQAATTAAVS